MSRRDGVILGLSVVALWVAPLGADCGVCGQAKKGDPEQRRTEMQEKHLGWLSEELKLTEDQKNQVKPILEEKANKMDALRDETHEKIKAVLTEDQKKSFDEMKAKGPWKMGCGCPMCKESGHMHGKSKKKK